MLSFIHKVTLPSAGKFCRIYLKRQFSILHFEGCVRQWSHNTQKHLLNTHSSFDTSQKTNTNHFLWLIKHSIMGGLLPTKTHSVLEINLSAINLI